MKYEKSCGALVYKHENDEYKLLLIKHKLGGHWSFPKGHVEKGETEKQTATREVGEETGIKIRVLPMFKESVTYAPKPNVKKEVVYFLAQAITLTAVRQEEEISQIEWMSLERAFDAVSFSNDKNLIVKAKKYLGLD